MMIIIVSLSLQIILFLQLVVMCRKKKGREVAGQTDVERSGTPTSNAMMTTPRSMAKSSANEDESKDGIYGKKEGQDGKKKSGEKKMEEKKTEEKKTEEKKSEEKKSEEKKTEEKKAGEKKAEKKKMEENKEEKDEEMKEEKKEEKKEERKEEKKGEKKEEKKDEKKEDKKDDKKDEKEKGKDEKKEDEKKDKEKKKELDKKGTKSMREKVSKKGEGKGSEKKDTKKQENKGPKLDVTPKELKWEFEQGQQPLKVTNNTDKRFAIKVRCSDNSIYSVAPVTTFIEAGKVLTIAVVRGKGALKKDKLVLCSIPVSKDETDAAVIFKENVTPNLDVITMDKRVF